MTAGRLYRAAEDAQAVPSATFLGSREWTPRKLDQTYGEWGGEQIYDVGAPPRVLPRGQVLGGNCLENLRTDPPATDPALQNGRCIVLPSGEFCGNNPLFASFSLAYESGDVTYYRHVPTYLRQSDQLGEWMGDVPGLATTAARVRVVENGEAQREWSFALCDRGADPLPNEEQFDCATFPLGTWLYWYVALSGVVPQAGFPGISVVNRLWTLTKAFGGCECKQTIPGTFVMSMHPQIPTPGSWWLQVSSGLDPILRYEGVWANGFDPVVLTRIYINATYIASAPLTLTINPS